MYKDKSSIIDLHVIENFLSEEECNQMIKLATPHLTKSGTLLNGKVRAHPGRTSSSAFLSFNHPLFYKIYEKAGETLGVPTDYFEFLQCTSYEETQQYKGHFDAFDPKSGEVIKKGQRTYTTLVYLNDDYEGGETHFPQLDIKVQPARGKAVIWNNCYGDNRIIPESLHAGLPVASGRKMIANLWLRNKSYGDKKCE